MRGLSGLGRRALPGSSQGGSRSPGLRGGYGYGSGGMEPQPGLWLLFVVLMSALLFGAWLVDRVSAVWCDVMGGTPTTYLADGVRLVLLAVVTAVGLVASIVVAHVGHRRGWWSWLGWRAAYRLAWLLSRPVQAWRRHRARPRPVSHAAPPVTVTASVPTAQVRGDRPPEVVDVELLIDGVWMPADRCGERSR